MSDKPVAKTLEERVADLEKKVESLSKALSLKVDQERYNKDHPNGRASTRHSR